jgi:hypothetical protein
VRALTENNGKDLLNNKLIKMPPDFYRLARRRNRRVPTAVRKVTTTQAGGKKTRQMFNLLFNRS